VIEGCDCLICKGQRDAPLEKRTWVYVQPRSTYEIAPCSCGNTDTQWSEFKHHLWCDKCQKDFMPKHGGLFEGPIAVELCRLLGISFDRFNLETQQIEPFEYSEES
jgi:hypothetical protein